MDNFEHALERENRRLNAEVERLTRERDKAERLGRIVTDERDTARAQRDEERAAFNRAAAEMLALQSRAEAAEADNAALLEEMKEAHDNIESISGDVFERPHPGTMLLEERKHIAKMLDTMDVPSESDEVEKGRACDFAGRVELLALWGQRGWREYRKTKDSEVAIRAELSAALTKMYSALVAFGAPESQPFDNAVAALLERLRAAEASANAWNEQYKQTERLRRAQGDRLDAAIAVIEAVRRMTGSDETMRMVTAAMVAYDALKEGA